MASGKRKQDVEARKRKIEAQQNAENINEEAQEIADKVTTIAQFRALEKRLETATNGMFTLKSDQAIENAQHKADVLQAAVDLLSAKPFMYQFVPDVNLDSSKEILERAYKVFSIKRYEKIKEESFFNGSDWYALGPDDEEEECLIDLEGLKRFRKIIDTNISREQKLRKLNQLIENHIDLFDEFLDPKIELTPGDQYFAWLLGDDGLPLAVELYKRGFTTRERCLDIKPEEFQEIAGADPEKVDQLVRYQAKLRVNEIPQSET